MTLAVINADWAGFAENLYRDGIRLLATQAQVMPSDGPAFMRALLQPWNMSYYAFVDESDAN